MTEKNLEKFKEIAYDYHRLEYIDDVYEHYITFEDEYCNEEAHIKLSDVYKQKYEFFKQILEDEGYSDDDIRMLECVNEKDFKYYYALCVEPEYISKIITLVPFLSEEHRQQFIDKHKDYYKNIIPFDPENYLTNNS